jgi:hypothetical protein
MFLFLFSKTNITFNGALKKHGRIFMRPTHLYSRTDSMLNSSEKLIEEEVQALFSLN